MPPLARRSLLGAAVLACAAARAAAADAPPFAGRVERLSIASQHLGAGRLLTVYLPPAFAAGGSYPVIYMADGQWAGAVVAVLDRLIQQGRIRPVVLVGLHAAADGEARHREYLPHFDGRSDADFDRHNRFFLGEVMPAMEARYGLSTDPGQRLLLGFSDGASWSIATALKQRRLFSRAAALSLGWAEAAHDLDDYLKPRFFLGCGKGEGVFRVQTERFASLARSKGYNVRFEIRDGVHGQALWTQMYPDIFEWAFGTKG